MKATAYYWCKMDGKGRAVPLAKRMTWAAIRRYEDRQPPFSGFVVTSYWANDPKDEDHGTVYFFDQNGGQVEMASC